MWSLIRQITLTVSLQTLDHCLSFGTVTPLIGLLKGMYSQTSQYP